MSHQHLENFSGHRHLVIWLTARTAVSTRLFIKENMSRYYTTTRFRPECPTCGNALGHLEESYKRLQEQGKTPHQALEALGIQRPCCRVRALWPVVLPIGGFFLPYHEAAMQNYLGFKEVAPAPNLVILSLRRAVTGEYFLVSHVDEQGFIGKITEAGHHEPTEVTIKVAGEERNVVMKDESELTKECEVRIQTEPGEISRGFPFQIRQFNRGIEVDRVRSWFDLAPTQDKPDVIQGVEPDLEELMAQEIDEEPLVATME